MWNYSWHTYYILTKRPERLFELIEQDAPDGLRDLNATHFPHVMIGVSAEDQAAAEERLPLLTQLPLPASQLFVSAEPLIDPLHLSKWIDQIGWVIAGGESGKHARPMHPDWARSLRDQCQIAGVNFHFKQWGEFVTEQPVAEAERMKDVNSDGALYRLKRGRKAHPVATLMQDGTPFHRVGRRRAGRILDGQYWNARPGKNACPVNAPHPIGSIVCVQGQNEWRGTTGTITTIRPDDPANLEFAGEAATYWITPPGSAELPQAFRYWQLQAI